MKKALKYILIFVILIMLCFIVDILNIFINDKPLLIINRNNSKYTGVFYDVYNCNGISKIVNKFSKYNCEEKKEDKQEDIVEENKQIEEIEKVEEVNETEIETPVVEKEEEQNKIEDKKVTEPVKEVKKEVTKSTTNIKKTTSSKESQKEVVKTKVEEKKVEEVKQEVTKNEEPKIEEKVEQPKEEPKVEITYTNETEEEVEKTTGKYNITVITTTKKTYKVGSDGSKELIDTKSSTKYDKSTFSATTEELKPEASALFASNKASYNELLGYVNNLRSAEGSSEMILDDNLSVAATIRALEIGWGSFSHTRPDGRSCFTIFNEMNLQSYYYGENIAAGSSTAKGAYNIWYNSPPHHENMVNNVYKKLGVGHAVVNGYDYWVQLFSA